MFNFKRGTLTFVIKEIEVDFDTKIQSILSEPLCEFYISSRQLMTGKDCYVPEVNSQQGFWKDLEKFKNNYLNVRVKESQYIYHLPEFKQYVLDDFDFSGHIIERVKRNEIGIVVLEPGENIPLFLDKAGLPPWVVGPVYLGKNNKDPRNQMLDITTIS